MDNVTDGYRRAIEQVLREWEALSNSRTQFAIVAVRDLEKGRFLLQEMERPHGLQISRTLAHLELRNDKVYIEFDGTEQGIADELVRAGIPKDKIVLAFYPPAIREMGEFALACALLSAALTLTAHVPAFIIGNLHDRRIR